MAGISLANKTGSTGETGGLTSVLVHNSFNKPTSE